MASLVLTQPSIITNRIDYERKFSVYDLNLEGGDPSKNLCEFSFIFNLRVNVRIIQSDAEQGSVDLTDFHIHCSVFHADSRGAIRFSLKNDRMQDYDSLKF